MGHRKPSPQNTDNTIRRIQQLLAWNTYQTSLNKLDSETFQEFQQTIKDLHDVLWIQVIIFGLEFIVITGVLIWGLGQITQNTSNYLWGGCITLISLFLLGLMFYRNPVKETKRVVLAITRIQIILQGYARQLHQGDAIFKQTLSADTIDPKALKKSLKQIQASIDDNLENLIQSFDDDQ